MFLLPSQASAGARELQQGQDTPCLVPAVCGEKQTVLEEFGLLDKKVQRGLEAERVLLWRDSRQHHHHQEKYRCVFHAGSQQRSQRCLPVSLLETRRFSGTGEGTLRQGLRGSSSGRSLGRRETVRVRPPPGELSHALLALSEASPCSHPLPPVRQGRLLQRGLREPRVVLSRVRVQVLGLPQGLRHRQVWIPRSARHHEDDVAQTRGVRFRELSRGPSARGRLAVQQRLQEHLLRDLPPRGTLRGPLDQRPLPTLHHGHTPCQVPRRHGILRSFLAKRLRSFVVRRKPRAAHAPSASVQRARDLRVRAARQGPRELAHDRNRRGHLRHVQPLQPLLRSLRDAELLRRRMRDARHPDHPEGRRGVGQLRLRVGRDAVRRAPRRTQEAVLLRVHVRRVRRGVAAVRGARVPHADAQVSQLRSAGVDRSAVADDVHVFGLRAGDERAGEVRRGVRRRRVPEGRHRQDDRRGR